MTLKGESLTDRRQTFARSLTRSPVGPLASVSSLYKRDQHLSTRPERRAAPLSSINVGFKTPMTTDVDSFAGSFSLQLIPCSQHDSKEYKMQTVSPLESSIFGSNLARRKEKVWPNGARNGHSSGEKCFTRAAG